MFYVKPGGVEVAGRGGIVICGDIILLKKVL